MNEYLEQVRENLGSGTITPQAMVLLYRAIEEAEEQRDAESLEQALALARQIAPMAGSTLGPEAERLVRLCEQSLERTQARTLPSEHAAAEPVDGACPGCGRPLPPNAVRCRSCGYLLV